ncbi:MAG: amidohydrolase family protein [Thermoplasmata archaeon]|nr:amidohydrolase family protein [Thermoplasmata archaeon]MCI4338098.1 amidohydrolase family protein [Thermoplasmata archaeon]MCI4341749.1 amidohydrolase family protein [Thermoplasmata archaeon]
MPARPRLRREAATARPVPSIVLVGRSLQRGVLRPVEVGLDESGEIVAIGRDLRGGRRHDLGEAVLLPSAVDLHVHFRSPDVPHEGENWARGTVQAALGGVGVAGEMPNAQPPTSSASRLEERRDRGRGRLAIDLLLYAALERPSEVPKLGRVAGGFKLYLAPTTGIEPPGDSDQVAELLRLASLTGLPVAVHAEDPGQFVDPERATNPVEWDRARPLEAEEGCVERLIASVPAGLRLHVAHVTSAETARRLKEAGHSFECTPHHLLLSDRSGDDARWKVNPPLRSEAVRAGLWEAFRDGHVPCLASDHAPHEREAKDRPFPRAPAGVPGVGTMLPLLLARARAGELSLDRLQRAACEHPARWLGLPAGRLALGHRGGIVAVDFRRRQPFHAARFRDSCGWSPFEGHEMIFPFEHWHRGERIVEGGEYVGRPTGQVVRPEYAHGASARVLRGPE